MKTQLLSLMAVVAVSVSGAAQQTTLVTTEGTIYDDSTGLPRRVLHPTSGIRLVLIPAGSFTMGSPAGIGGKEERQHRRVIRKAFYLGATEVTVGQFRKFVQATGYETDAERGSPAGGEGKGGFAATPDGDRTWTATASWQNPFPNLPEYKVQEDHPVIHVSWNDAQKFCAHFGLRLPSEAQWEYACRAGSAAQFPWGESEAGGDGYANVADRSKKQRFPSTNVLFPFDDGVVLLSPVGRYRANAWMLHDMIGNVEEWCEDVNQPYPADGSDETAAQGDGKTRVLRGGAWNSNSTNARSAARVGMLPFWRRDFQGFRVAAHDRIQSMTGF